MIRQLWKIMEVESPSEHVLCELGSGGGWLSRAANNKMFQTAVSASVGASCTAFVATPLDVVKTRMQSHVCPVGIGLTCNDNGHFKNTWVGGFAFGIVGASRGSMSPTAESMLKPRMRIAVD